MKASSSKTLVLIVLIAFFFLNYPWLSLFSETLLVFGFPLFYVYLFGFWLVFIIAVSLFTERLEDSAREDQPEPGGGDNHA